MSYVLLPAPSALRRTAVAGEGTHARLVPSRVASKVAPDAVVAGGAWTAAAPNELAFTVPLGAAFDAAVRLAALVAG